MADRETIMAALLATIAAAYSFGKLTRRLARPEAMASPGSPGAALLKHREMHEVKSINLPTKITLKLLLGLYVDCSGDANAIPDALLNVILKAIESALAPDTPQGLCTLGGVAFSVKITGEAVFAPGDITGKGLCLLPIDVILP
jgi:hypothetical protein